ncbi:MAG: hypothetical protein GXP46_08925 [Deferribacteres bacterium]|nr:hypothetical protein [Deferribacteres bacterium]
MAAGQHTIEIGNVLCSIAFEKGFFRNEFGAVLSGYERQGFCTEGKPDISITVKNTSAEAARTSGRNIFRHSLRYDSICATLTFDTREFRGEIAFSIEDLRGDIPLRGIELIETFICNAYLFYFLLNGRGTFIHSSGVSDGENGYIFSGSAGNGKSTIARLSRPRTVLCDEIVLLQRNEHGEKMVFGTPFAGEAGGVNRGVPCRGIYFIEKSGFNEISRVSRMYGVTELMKEGINGGFIALADIQRIYPYARFLALVSELLKGVPCYRMKFRKDRSFWEVIHGQTEQARQEK